MLLTLGWVKAASRAVLAVLLLVGVYVVAAGIVAVLAWGVVFALQHGVRGVLAGKLVGVAALTTIGLLLALLQRARKHDEEEPGTVLAAEAQPRLWSEVRALADTVGTRPPDEIRLVPEINAAVSERSRMLGLVAGKRTMYLGAPLLMGLSRQQLRSVLAHELGHYSRRHTALGGVTYLGHEAIGRVVERFGRDSAVGKVFAAYARLYQVVTFAVTRKQEIEADDFSVEVAGRDAACAALAELPVLHAAWEHYFEEFLTPVHSAGKRPADLFQGFGQVLEAPRLQVALASFRTDFAEPERSRYDSHPPLSARIERFRAMPEDGVPEDPTRAIEVLDDVNGTLRELQEWMYQEVALEAVPWTDLLQGHEPADVRARAEMLYRAAKAAEHTEISLGTIVASLRGRRLSSWVRPHLHDPTDENVREASRELVQCAVDEALMSVAGARVALAWDEEACLVDPGGQVLDSRPVVERAISSCDPAALRDWLAGHGVGIDHVPDFSELDPRREAARQAPRVLQALAPIAGHRKLFCIVLSHGVLLRKARGGDHVAWWLGGHDPGRHLLRRVVRRSARELLDEDDNIWLPWDGIASVTLGRGRTRRPKLTFRCTDGRTYVVKYRMHTKDTGETLEALRFFLEDRVSS